MGVLVETQVNGYSVMVQHIKNFNGIILRTMVMVAVISV